MTEPTPLGRAIVIGGGPAGCSCASWLALQGIAATLVEQEPQLLPGLTRLDLEQSWVLGHPRTSTAELAQAYALHVQQEPLVEVRCGAGIAAIDRLEPRIKRIRLSDGSTIEGQCIVIATGLQPRRLPMTGDGGHPLDAEALTRQRPTMAGRRVLLLGGGDNAVENALWLVERGNTVVLWSRSTLRAQAHLQRQLASRPEIELRIGLPMPDRAQRRGTVWEISCQGRTETFDEVAALLGYEPNTAAWGLLQRSPAWAQAGWPSAPLERAEDLLGLGFFLAGDVSQRLHPCIQTALADGVTAAKQIHRWMTHSPAPSRAYPGPGSALRAANQVLTLTGLRFDANLGILDHEKTAPQPIRVDAELNLGAQPVLPADDEIHHVLDYRKVRKIIIDECTAEHVNLLESLIGKLAHRLMQLPGVVGARVQIAKLEIFDDCEVAIKAEIGQW